MTKRIALAVPLLLVAGAALWFFSRSGATTQAGIRASGTVEATEVDLGFQLPGRVEEVLPREGQQVTAGETLARLETTELEAGRLAAEAQLRAAEARLVELRAGGRPEEVAQAQALQRSAGEQAGDARREAERLERLFNGGAASRQAFERAQTTVAVAAAELERATAGLALVREGARVEAVRAQEALAQQARANLQRTEAVLQNAVAVAPFSGRVTIRHREPGESVGAGVPVLTLMDPDDRWVRIFVPENRIGAVQLGMPASITSDTYPERAYRGEVVFVGDEAEFTPRNVQTTEERTRLVYPVKVRIVGDPGFELKPGLPADVVIETP
ncbi:MAG: HlyD family efflux transporter periplasmic adaptor subunit [Gemmatimonadetes bacterium]|nr:HlyD family efflux transporter periplasmic adaptor subunit [Gemmatimonadota bacterium]